MTSMREAAQDIDAALFSVHSRTLDSLRRRVQAYRSAIAAIHAEIEINMKNSKKDMRDLPEGESKKAFEADLAAADVKKIREILAWLSRPAWTAGNHSNDKVKEQAFEHIGELEETLEARIDAKVELRSGHWNKRQSTFEESIPEAKNLSVCFSEVKQRPVLETMGAVIRRSETLQVSVQPTESSHGHLNTQGHLEADRDRFEEKEWKNSMKHIANIVAHMMKTSSIFTNFVIAVTKSISMPKEQQLAIRQKTAKFSESIFERHRLMVKLISRQQNASDRSIPAFAEFAAKVSDQSKAELSSQEAFLSSMLDSLSVV